MLKKLAMHLEHRKQFILDEENRKQLMLKKLAMHLEHRKQFILDEENRKQLVLAEENRKQLVLAEENRKQFILQEEHRNLAFIQYDLASRKRRQPAIDPQKAIARQQALHHENVQKQQDARDMSIKIQQELYDEKIQQQQSGHVAYVEENIMHQAVHDEKVKRQRVAENTTQEKGRGKLKKTKDAVQTPFLPGVADQEEERFTAFLIERRKQMEELDKATQSWKTRNFAAWSKKELWQQERDRELSLAVYRQGHPNPCPDFH